MTQLESCDADRRFEHHTAGLATEERTLESGVWEFGRRLVGQRLGTRQPVMAQTEFVVQE